MIIHILLALVLVNVALADRKKEALFTGEKDHSLSNHVIKSFTVQSPIDCAMKCTENSLCKSTNSQHQSSDVTQCQLNNQTKRSAASADFKPNAGFDYYEKDPCVPSPCSYAGTCSKDQSSDGFLCSCMPGYKGPLCETERLGWSQRNPGKSCLEIMSSGDSKGDGAYWIDPGKTGNPFKVFCDMNAEQGGWLLITNVVIPSSAVVPSASMGTTYRHIANYNDNKTIISATALGQLRQLVNFTQLRFQCYRATVGRKVHIITKTSASGYAVVDYYSAKSNVRPAACLSFYKGAGDSSELAARCSQWSNGKWGSGSRINDKRLIDHTFYVAGKYHFISKLDVLRCDANNPKHSAGDYWKIYIR